MNIHTMWRWGGVLALAITVLPAGCMPSSSSSEGRTASPAALQDTSADQSGESSMKTSEVDTVRVRVLDSKGELVTVNSPRVVKTDEQWQAQLTPEQYEIARGKGTEQAYCGTLLDNKLEGVYACICCNLPLFASSAKFDSGSGWPSFFRPIAPENVIEHADTSFGMVRTEILCARCDAHLGHVFDDGPRPTGQRHCVNSESLVFFESQDLAKLAEDAKKPATSNPASEKLAKAVFGGGCFWCVEAVFEELAGVKEVVSGYAGDSKASADYKAVSTGQTRHAEAVEITYDPSKVTFEELLKVHFATHDPTTLNRQGADVGPQYRSAIFYLDNEQKQIAEAFIADLNDAKVYDKPIVTTLEPLKGDAFYPAETYHQNYVCNNPMQGYVRSVALPKVEKVRKQFKDMLKDKSPLESAPR